MSRRGASARTLHADPAAPLRPCDAPGCLAAGEFRAPKSRSRLDEYAWFCLPHVRGYNQAWDYYKGMGQTEIEAHLREDTAWQRPTWPLGRLGGARRHTAEYLADPLGLLLDTPLHARRGAKREEPVGPPPELRAALDVLGLEWPLDQPALKTRYKELAKRFHPDVNGGDRGSEDKLKDVNRAYSLLRQRLGAARGVAAAAGASAP